MRLFSLLLVSLLYLANLPALAAGDVSHSTPSVAERLTDARKYIDTKNWSRAAFELDKAVREEPKNADVYNMLGFYNRKKPNADLPKAFENYNMALKLDPKHRAAHEYLGEAYLMDKKPAEAEKLLANLEVLCGNKNCEEYKDLAEAIAKYKAGQ
jgi:cytochrome c-type biogenesis protein CcmH/NrfG